MKFIDLTHPISHDMPVYPGTESPAITQPCTIDLNGFNEKRLTMYSHTGTHMDSPAHILKSGRSLDLMPVDRFYGSATVIDVSGVPEQQIGPEHLNDIQNNNIDFVILYTGWCHKWGTADYFSDFPVLSCEAAEYLSRQKIKGVGIDTISVDRVNSTDFTIHKIILEKNLVIIENLTNLAGLSGKVFTLSCFPLKICCADGSPVRAVAICE